MNVGFGCVDITPPVGIELAGYGPVRTRTALSVHDRLSARAVVFQAGGRRALVINLDLIGMSVEMAADVKGRIQRETGIAEADAIIACIHSHSAPAALPMLAWGETSPSYLESLPDAIVQAVKTAADDLDDVRSARQFVAPFAGIGYNRTDPHEGLVDRRLRGLAIVRQARPPIMMLNYACHPVTLGANREVSADYPGQVCAVLGEMGYLGAFLNGCHGDIDPLTHRAAWGSGTFATIRHYGEIIVRAGLEGLARFGREMTDETISSASDTASLATDAPDVASVKETLARADAALVARPLDADALFSKAWAARTLALLESGRAANAIEMPVQAVRVGEVVFVALPGEIFTTFGLAIADAAGDANAFVLSNANGTIAYVPTREDLAQGGYAGTRANRIYGRFQFKPDAGDRMVALAGTLVARTLEENHA